MRTHERTHPTIHPPTRPPSLSHSLCLPPLPPSLPPHPLSLCLSISVPNPSPTHSTNKHLKRHRIRLHTCMHPSDAVQVVRAGSSSNENARHYTSQNRMEWLALEWRRGPLNNASHRKLKTQATGPGAAPKSGLGPPAGEGCANHPPGAKCWGHRYYPASLRTVEMSLHKKARSAACYRKMAVLLLQTARASQELASGP